MISSELSNSFARSRGLPSSVKLSISNSLGLAALINGAWAAAATFDILPSRDVLRMTTEFIVTDQATIRRATESTKLFLIHFLEQIALIKLRRFFQIAQQLFFVACITRSFSEVEVSVFITK